MNKVISLAPLLFATLAMVGCETTNSIPYKASTDNIISIQKIASNKQIKVRLNNFTLAPGIDESPTCRLMGPVRVAPGKTIPEYVKDAFQEELFAAHAYDPDAITTINGRIEKLSFSSVSPANWEVSLKVSSNRSPGYTESVNYAFDTSFTAYSACKNVADAFGPAVQELLHRVVTSPQFLSLISD